MNYEEVLSKYKFLNKIENQNGEEIEVTEEAIQIYHKYDIYKCDWKIHKYHKPRNQMSTGGSWLYKENENTIDIVGDVLTAKSAFKYLKDNGDEIVELYNLFKRIYHTLGNCMPWCEGANLGGRPYKNGGSPDVFARKLNICKSIFDRTIAEEYKDTEIVRNRIIQGKYLGYGVKNITCLCYWIEEEWIKKGKVWKDFVKEHYLIDMVDEELNPIPFIVGEDRNDNNLVGKSDDVIKKTLNQSIKLIIKRGYRIQNAVKEPFSGAENKKVQEIFSKLNI